MRVFCPHCGSENQAVASKVACAACGTAFEVPREPAPRTVRPPAPAAPSPLGGFDGLRTEAPAHSPPRALASVPINPLAIISLVCGLLCCVPFVTPTTAVITGFIAIKQIDAAQPPSRGKPLAISGIALGVFTWLLTVLAVIGNLAK